MANYNQYMYKNGQWVKIGSSIPGSGASDYDSLLHIPVKNVNGSDENHFINLSGLEFGRYLITGYYKFDSVSDLIYSELALDIIVTKDVATDEKVIMYGVVENSKWVTKVVVYLPSGLVKKESTNAGIAQEAQAIVYEEF